MAFWPTYRFWENAYECYFHAAIKKSSDLLVAIFFGKALGVKKDVSNIWHTFLAKNRLFWTYIYIYKKIFSEVEKSEKIDFSKNAPYYF